MNLNHLKYFYQVAKSGGFTSAAKQLRINQPGITKAVKELEIELGVKLFDRLKKSVYLTQHGNEVFRYCEVIFGNVQKIQNACSNKKKECQGSLLIGASESIVNYILPSVINKLVADHPNLYPTIITSSGADLIKKLEAKELDLLVGFYFPKNNLDVRCAFEIDHYLVIASKVYKSKKVRESFIGSRETENKQEKIYPTLKRLQEDYPNASIKISCNSQSAHLSMVKNGLGVSILPNFIVQKDIHKGSLKCLYPKEAFRWPVRVLTKQNLSLTSCGEKFIEYFKREIATFQR
ncbi:MAG: LysR family transcriptional regulator [Oligoflexales bacterium]|nr:LysR family transcriptional regulator [Oligoflexales bacterium]